MPPELFASEFFTSLISSETSNRFSLSEYFRNVYNRTYDFNETLPYLLSQCEVSVTAPFSYEAAGLNAFCLIHTTKGAGRLLYHHLPNIPPLELTKGTLAFIDCRKTHKILSLHNVWEYTICFVSSPISSYYHEKLEAFGGCLFPLQTEPDALLHWELLLKNQIDDEAHALIRSRELISLYTQLYLSRSLKIQGTYHIPSYLIDMKKNFDDAYTEQYALDALSVKYHVNKYRLCREFAKYYEDTPLQYLNKVRIEKAKNLLVHSDEKIGVIGTMVGIENTNHFIRLFKEKTGVTPLNYRRETPVL